MYFCMWNIVVMWSLLHHQVTQRAGNSCNYRFTLDYSIASFPHIVSPEQGWFRPEVEVTNYKEISPSCKIISPVHLWAPLWVHTNIDFVALFSSNRWFFNEIVAFRGVARGGFANKIQFPYDKHHKTSSLVKSPQNRQFCQIWSNTKMSNSPAKYVCMKY